MAKWQSQQQGQKHTSGLRRLWTEYEYEIPSGAQRTWLLIVCRKLCFTFPTSGASSTGLDGLLLPQVKVARGKFLLQCKLGAFRKT